MERCDLYFADVRELNAPGRFALWESRMPAYRREKIRSFRFEEGRRLSLGVGALLFLALAERGIDYASAAYGEGEYGKPYLPEHPGIHYSLSHAGVWAVCAVSALPVGCDAEAVGRGSPAISNRFFHPSERDALSRETDPAAWQRLFCRIWTRKESYLKATGVGLAGGMEGFSTLAATENVHYAEMEADRETMLCCCQMGQEVPEVRWREIHLGTV